MPPPKDVNQVRSFLGMLNYYGHFVEEMRQLRAPLDNLLKKDAVFKWSTECQEAFNRAKEVLNSDLLLTHYDPSQEIVVAADASEYGIGAVISHRFSDGMEKPIYHASRSLTTAEKNYGQVEKEGLALVFAVRKFHKYLHGRHFKLLTDHKPLLSIYGSKKGVPVYTANRLQRWCLIMMNYNFTIEYRNTNDFGQADVLSRLISEQSAPLEDKVIAKIAIDSAQVTQDACSKLPVTAAVIAEETKQDPILKEVLQYVVTGQWPRKPAERLQRFVSQQSQINVDLGCLKLGNRIIIPDRLQAAVLQELHSGHPGISRMKQLARDYCYWINIDKDIEDRVRSCVSCQEHAKNPIKNHLHSWPMEEEPWSRVHADFAGPLNDRMYLVIVDAYSKWPDVIEMSTTTSTATIKELHRIFAYFGYPRTFVTDNGIQFTSKEFADFCLEHGIKHLRSPPFHPQSNGQAERFVDTFKRAIAKLRREGEATPTAIQKFLLTYRRTPCASSPGGLSPAENFYGRRIRSQLSLLKPSATPDSRRNEKMEEQFNRHHGTAAKDFQPKEPVWIRDYRHGHPRWIKGHVISRRGQTNYDVQHGEIVWKNRHANQLRRRQLENADAVLTEFFDLPLLPLIDNEPEPEPETANATTDLPSPGPSPAPAVRPTRTRAKPNRLQLDPKKKSYTASVNH